jgi:protein-disulfide isomerase
MWLTGGAVVVGIALVAFLVFVNRPAESLALAPPTETKPPGVVDGRALGSASAPVTLDAWEDFQCPSCDIYSRAAEPRLVSDYVVGGRLRIVFHDFAFIGQESIDAAVAARAAGNQGAFWAYHDWLFANQNGENRGGFRRAVLVQIARDLGLDIARFEKDLDDPATTEAVKAETKSGLSVPVHGTPTLVVNGKVLDGFTWDVIAPAIDAALPPSASGSPSPSAPASP